MVRFRRYTAGLCLLALLISCLSLMGCEPKAGPPPYRTLEVTYAGVKGYGSVAAESKDNFTYRF